METRSNVRHNRATSHEFYKKLFILTIGGGVVFWVITIAISLLPIAAEYRAAFSNRNILAVWVGSLPAGMIIGGCVSYFLLRFYARIPTGNPILKSGIMGFIALIIAIILIDVPQSFLLLEPGNALHYFLIGVMLNVPRFVLASVFIGYLYQKRYWSA